MLKLILLNLFILSSIGNNPALRYNTTLLRRFSEVQIRVKQKASKEMFQANYPQAPKPNLKKTPGSPKLPPPAPPAPSKLEAPAPPAAISIKTKNIAPPFQQPNSIVLPVFKKEETPLSETKELLPPPPPDSLAPLESSLKKEGKEKALFFLPDFIPPEPSQDFKIEKLETFQRLSSRTVFIDLESTGLEYDAGIIELAAIVTKWLTPTGETFHVRANPKKEMQEKALEITGYTWEMLKDQPHISSYKKEFLKAIENSTLVFHNTSLDITLLNRHFNINLESLNPVIDTYRLARSYEYTHSGLEALCKKLDVKTRTFKHHTAFTDADDTRQVFAHFLIKHGGETLKAISETPNLNKNKRKFTKKPSLETFFEKNLLNIERILNLHSGRIHSAKAFKFQDKENVLNGFYVVDKCLKEPIIFYGNPCNSFHIIKKGDDQTIFIGSITSSTALERMKFLKHLKEQYSIQNNEEPSIYAFADIRYLSTINWPEKTNKIIILSDKEPRETAKWVTLILERLCASKSYGILTKSLEKKSMKNLRIRLKKSVFSCTEDKETETERIVTLLNEENEESTLVINKNNNTVKVNGIEIENPNEKILISPKKISINVICANTFKGTKTNFEQEVELDKKTLSFQITQPITELNTPKDSMFISKVMRARKIWDSAYPFIKNSPQFKYWEKREIEAPATALYKQYYVKAFLKEFPATLLKIEDEYGTQIGLSIIPCDEKGNSLPKYKIVDEKKERTYSKTTEGQTAKGRVFGKTILTKEESPVLFLSEGAENMQSAEKALNEGLKNSKTKEELLKTYGLEKGYIFATVIGINGFEDDHLTFLNQKGEKRDIKEVVMLSDNDNPENQESQRTIKRTITKWLKKGLIVKIVRSNKIDQDLNSFLRQEGLDAVIKSLANPYAIENLDDLNSFLNGKKKNNPLDEVSFEDLIETVKKLKSDKIKSEEEKKLQLLLKEIHKLKSPVKSLEYSPPKITEAEILIEESKLEEAENDNKEEAETIVIEFSKKKKTTYPKKEEEKKSKITDFLKKTKVKPKRADLINKLSKYIGSFLKQ